MQEMMKNMMGGGGGDMPDMEEMQRKPTSILRRFHAQFHFLGMMAQMGGMGGMGGMGSMLAKMMGAMGNR